MYYFKYILTALALLIMAGKAYSQDSTRLDQLLSLPDKLFGSLDKKSRDLEEKLSRQTDRYLSRLERQEQRLKKKLARKDSALAKELFAGVEGCYIGLRQAPEKVSKSSGVYSGHLDSLATGLKFLKANSLASGPELEKSLQGFKELQASLDHSELVKKYLSERQRLLHGQLEKLGMVRELKQFRKEVYYYQAQVRAYKEAFEDPSKLEAQLMQVLSRVPAFRAFFARHSQLGGLFALPANINSIASLQGLQTRASFQQVLQNRFGSGPGVAEALRQNLQAAQGQLDQLKDKLAQYGSGSFGNGSSDMELPDFRVNTERTKTFGQRLEYSLNIQSQKARSLFPVRSDIGVSLGYRLNQKSILGVGVAYKVGWGRGWDQLELSHQGVGLRSFVDYKLKGTLYLSGGYEQNYQSAIRSIDLLKNRSAWQVSGLMGLSKRYKVGKKLKGEMKLLWDFLSYQQVPKAQALLFRVGYSLK